jgi:MFS family permease
MHTALRHPRFGRLLAALVASQIGDWLYNVALLAYVDSRTHSTTWLGLTTAARVAPLVIAGPLGGVVADRFDRRAVMIATDVIRAATMALLAIVAIAGLPVILAPMLAALATLAAAPYGPCVAASTPRLVDDADLPAANAARAAIAPTCIVLGPALGAVLLLVGPPSAAFVLNGLTFVVSALLVASLPAGPAFRPVRSDDDATERPSVAGDLRAGAAALTGQPAACRLVIADVTCSAVYGAQTVLLLLVAERLDLGVHGYGYLLGAVGLGGIIGAAVAARLGAGEHRSALAGALLAVATPLPLMAVTHSVALTMLLALVGGIGALVVEVLAESGLQRTLDDDVLGRAYGFVLAAALGGIVAGSLLAPLLVEIAGVGGALTILGAAVALIAARSARRPRRAVRRGALAPEPASAV